MIIHVHQPAPFLLRSIEKRRADHYPRVIHQDIQASIRLHRLPGQGLRGFPLRDIAGHHHAAHPVSPKLRGQIPEAFRINPVEYQVRSALGEGPGAGPPDAPGRPGDNGRLSLQGPAEAVFQSKFIFFRQTLFSHRRTSFCLTDPALLF